MKPTLRLTAALALALLLGLSVSAQTKTITGKVVAIADGDTVTVLDASKGQHRIRLQGIDTPERAQDFGARSKESLSGMVFGKEVRVEYEKLDQYGCVLGKVMAGGRDVNLEQVKAGMAWHYKYYEREQRAVDRKLYADAELEARKAKRGLWEMPEPTPPWEFRRSQRVESPASPDQPSQPAASAQPRQSADAAETKLGPVVGNRRSMIYHWPGCPGYTQISPHNRVHFPTREAAEHAGYRAARNCK
jgi:endonuclease YncB( thermonuclease family)